MQADGLSNMDRVVSNADTVRRRRLMAVATVALLVALIAVAEVVSHSGSRSGAARTSLEQTSLDLLWERDNHLALNSALAAVKSAARAQQLAQLPALAQRPDSVPQPLVHSWVPPATQQLSSFQNWLQKEQAKISSYTGPKDPLAPAARQPTSSLTTFGKPLKFGQPLHFHLPASVTNGLNAVQKAQAELARKQEEVVPPGFRLACYQEVHGVGPCESTPYKPLKQWYHDYRTKGKYSADLLWDRNRRLKSEMENKKSWERIKNSAAPGQGDNSDHWFRWKKSDKGMRASGSRQSQGAYTYSSSNEYDDDGKLVHAGEDENFSWPDDDDAGGGGGGGGRGDSSGGVYGGRPDGTDGTRGGGDAVGGNGGGGTESDSASSSSVGSGSSSADTGGRSEQEERPVIVNAPAPKIDGELAASIKGLADMVKEMSGMLTNWQPNVTVKTVPVDVKVDMPTPKNWGSVWKAAENVLDHGNGATSGAIAGGVSSGGVTSSAPTPEAHALGLPTPHPHDKRVLDPPTLQPGGGVFDGSIAVNISSSGEDDAVADGNASLATIVHVMMSAPAPAPEYKSFPMVKQDILQMGNESAAIAVEDEAEDYGNTSVTAADIDEGGQVYSAPLVLEPGSVVISAYASREGWEDSPVVSQTYDVLTCGSDQCCQWSVVYMRVRRLLDTLIAKNATLVNEKRLTDDRMNTIHEEWLRSNARYQAALMRTKDEQRDTQYALGKQEMWKEARHGSMQQLMAVKKLVHKHLDDLAQERALIKWILAQMEGAELSPATALGRVEQSLTDVTGSDTMGDLQKILASAQASVAGNRGRVHEVPGQALQQESDEGEDIAKILREMISDLTAREKIFESMLNKAQTQLSDNSVKAKEWDGKLSKVASDVEESRATISEEALRRQVLAGKLLVAQQAVEALATSFPGQQEMLAASIASYTRVIATLQSKARGACAAVLKAQKTVELEERQVQSLMGKIRRTPSSALTPQLKSQMAVLQQMVNEEAGTHSGGSSADSSSAEGQTILKAANSRKTTILRGDSARSRLRVSSSQSDGAARLQSQPASRPQGL